MFLFLLSPPFGEFSLLILFLILIVVIVQDGVAHPRRLIQLVITLVEAARDLFLSVVLIVYCISIVLLVLLLRIPSGLVRTKFTHLNNIPVMLYWYWSMGGFWGRLGLYSQSYFACKDWVQDWARWHHFKNFMACSMPLFHNSVVCTRLNFLSARYKQGLSFNKASSLPRCILNPLLRTWPLLLFLLSPPWLSSTQRW